MIISKYITMLIYAIILNIVIYLLYKVYNVMYNSVMQVYNIQHNKILLIIKNKNIHKDSIKTQESHGQSAAVQLQKSLIFGK